MWLVVSSPIDLMLPLIKMNSAMYDSIKDVIATSKPPIVLKI